MRAPFFVAAVTAILALPAAYAHHTGDIVYDPAAQFAPTPDEVAAVVESMRGHEWAEVHQVGSSIEGVPIYVIALTDPASVVPMDQRVVTFIMTQQHGNEPAGTPAALQVLEAIRDGTGYREYLDNQVLLVMPQSNPDGSLDGRRTNEDGVDINRDHVGVQTPEAQAIHAVLRMWDVHLALDHHEYSGSGVGHPAPVHTYDFDITTMYPNHGNVREPTSALSLELNYERIKPRLEAEGFSHGDYGVQTVTAGPVKHEVAQTAGGPDPGILRNNYGLNNVAGLLIESYVPRYDAQTLAALGEAGLVQDFERRVESHRVVMDETLRFAHEDPARIIAAKRESERLNLEAPMAQYMEGDRRGPMPAMFRTEAAHAHTFDVHALPPPFSADGGHVSVVAQERGGLLAAMLHERSSRHIEAAGAADVAVDPGYLGHPDFRPAVVEVHAPADQDVPLPLVVPLAVLLAGSMVRRAARRPGIL